MTLDLGETIFFKSLLSVLKLLKLDEGEVKMLKQRPKYKKDIK